MLVANKFGDHAVHRVVDALVLDIRLQIKSNQIKSNLLKTKGPFGRLHCSN